MRRWKLLPCHQGRAVDGSHEAPRRHGAAPGVGRRLRRGCRHLASRTHVVRHALCDHRADAVRDRWWRARPMAVGLMSTATRALRMGYDYARGAVNIEEPVLLAVCPTLVDPERAPAGRHTVKVIGFQPYDLKEGPQHWDEIKERVSQANLDHLRRFATNLTDDKNLAPVVESPLDLQPMKPHHWRGSRHGGAQNPAPAAEIAPVPR